MGWSETRAFLSKVVAWPVDNPGFVNLHYSFPNERGGKDIVTGRPFRTIDELISFANWARTKNIKEIWYCTSLQSTAGQTQAGKPKAVRLHHNALALKTIWIDLDVGNKPETPDKNYDTIEEAWAAFVAFRAAAHLPAPSAIVKSGGGLHIYWLSSRVLTPAEWAPYAHGLKTLLIEHGLKCDAGLTTDDVRLLRLPSTLNYKYDPPRPVELLPLPLTEYDFAGTFSFLAELAPAVASSTDALPASFIGKTPILVATDKLSDGIERTESPPLPALPIAKGCAFIRDALLTGGKDYAQPMWNLSTLAATFMEDGHALAHKMGRGHPGYSSASTDELWARKLRERADRGLGWPSCQAIQASGCGSCAGCPHFAAGKSPLNLGINAPAVRDVVSRGVLPYGYIHDEKGFICKVEEKQNKKGETFEIVHRLLNSKIDSFWAQKSAAADVLHFQSTYDKGNVIMAHLSLADMVGGQIGPALADVHVKINPDGKRFLEGFFVSLLTKLHEEMAAQECQPFGWLVKGGETKGFVYGGRVYHNDGTETAAGVADAQIGQWYRPTGELKPWLDVCKMVTDLGRPELNALVAVSFAAPLMRMAGEDGVTISAWDEGGSGKSSAMKVGLAVWSDPAQTKEGVKTTPKSLFNKMGELRHLPIYWDELATKAAQAKAVEVSFDQTSGVEGGRMNANVTQRARGSWRTILALAANTSLVELVIKEQPSHRGGINRVFEYEVGPNDPSKLLSPTDVGRKLETLEHHHGVVGMQYAKFLGTNFATIDSEVKEARKQVERDLRTSQEERFWTCAVATILTGAKYANQFGTEFDLNAMKEFLYATLRANREKSRTEGGGGNSMEDILTQYLKSRAHTQTIWTDGLRAGKRPATVILLHQPPPTLNVLHGIQVRWDVPSRKLLISRSDFTGWLDHREVPWGAMHKWLKKTYGIKIDKVVLASGTTYRNGQEHVIFIDVPPDSPMEDIMMQYKELSDAKVIPFPPQGAA